MHRALGKGQSAAIRKHADERAADILPAIKQLQESGCVSLHTIAAGLTRRAFRPRAAKACGKQRRWRACSPEASPEKEGT